MKKFIDKDGVQLNFLDKVRILDGTDAIGTVYYDPTRKEYFIHNERFDEKYENYYLGDFSNQIYEYLKSSI